MATRARGTGITTTTSGAVALPAVDLSTFPTGDGKPMAENFVNQLQMVGLQQAVRRLLEQQGRTRAAIGGNQFLYYNPHNRRANLSLDVYVALDVQPGGRNVWFTWVEGKAPDIVWEITSPSTQREDLSTAPRGKRTLYGQLGVREYYVYDPVYDPREAMQPRLRAFMRRGERLEEVELLPSGGVWSELLGAELRPLPAAQTEWEPAGTYLRVIDPATGAPIRVGEEMQQDYRATQEQLVAALQGQVRFQEQLNASLQARLELQEQLTESLQARGELQAHLTEETRARTEEARARLELERQLTASLRARTEEARARNEEIRARVEAQEQLAEAAQAQATLLERLLQAEQARLSAEERARQREAALPEPPAGQVGQTPPAPPGTAETTS